MASIPAIGSTDRFVSTMFWPRRALAVVSAVCVLGLAWGVAPARAEEPTAAAQAFSDTIDVELVNVDVWVTDRQGKPVTNLPRSAFSVTHDGDPVQLTNFFEFGVAEPGSGGVGAVEAVEESEASAKPGAGEGEAAIARDYLIVYVDQLRLQPRDYGPVLRGLAALLDQPSVVPERVLILRQDQGLSVEAHLGSSRDQLEDALERLGTLDATGMQAASELEQALDSLRREWRESKDLAGARSNAISAVPPPPGGGQNDGPRGALGSGSFGPDACDLFVQRVGPTIDGWTRNQAQRTSISLGLLTQTATFLAGLPGVKTVLYVGDGLEPNPGAALTNYVSGLCPTGESVFAIDNLGEQLSNAFLDLTRHLNSNRVTVYAFQAGGLRTSSTSSAATEGSAGGNDNFRAQGSFDQRRRDEAKAGLEVLAGETGGRRLSHQDELVGLGSLLGSRYSLAYPLPAGVGTEHRITVKIEGVETAGYDVRYRRSYLEKTPEERLAEMVQGALYLGLVENSLGLRLGAGDLKPTEGAQWLVPLRVMVPVGSLTFDLSAPVPAAVLAVQVVARHLETGELWKKEQAFRIKRPAGGEFPEGQLLQLPIDLTVDKGPCSIVVGARDEISRQTSVVSTALDVGPPR